MLLALQVLKLKGGKFAIACGALQYSAGSIAAILDWFTSDEERARFQADMEAMPESNTACVDSIKRLRDSLGPAAAMDVAYASLEAFAKYLAAASIDGAGSCWR